MANKKKKEITAGEVFPDVAQRKLLLELHLAWVQDLLELSENATHRQFPRDGVKYLVEVENMLSGLMIHEDYQSFFGLKPNAYEILDKLHQHFTCEEVEETVM